MPQKLVHRRILQAWRQGETVDAKQLCGELYPARVDKRQVARLLTKLLQYAQAGYFKTTMAGDGRYRFIANTKPLTAEQQYRRDLLADITDPATVALTSSPYLTRAILKQGL